MTALACDGLAAGQTFAIQEREQCAAAWQAAASGVAMADGAPRHEPELVAAGSPMDDDDEVEAPHRSPELSKMDEEEEELLDVVSTASLDGPDQEEDFSEDEEYFKPIKRLCMMEAPANPSPKPLTSFFIKDILSHKPARRAPGIVRPWDLESPKPGRRRPRSTDEDSRSERSESDSPDSPAAGQQQHSSTSPLDALFEMTSKAFEGLESGDRAAGEYRPTSIREKAAGSPRQPRPFHDPSEPNTGHPSCTACTTGGKSRLPLCSWDPEAKFQTTRGIPRITLPVTCFFRFLGLVQETGFTSKAAD